MAFGANFISSWIRIRIRNADPDPGDKSNADPCGSGSETLLSMSPEFGHKLLLRLCPSLRRLHQLNLLHLYENKKVCSAGFLWHKALLAALRQYVVEQVGQPTVANNQIENLQQMEARANGQ